MKPARRRENLARRIRVYQNFMAQTRHEEGVGRRVRSGGYHCPGSMQAGK